MAKTSNNPSKLDTIRAMASKSLLAYSILMNPEFQTPNYIKQYAAKLEDALRRVENGERVYMQVFMPPQHGKSTLGANNFIPWVMGQHPDWAIAYGTYSQEFADERGSIIRNVLQDPTYREIFPQTELSRDSSAKANMATTASGRLMFVGRGGALSGRVVKIMVIDDPLKNMQEADSAATRKELHSWYNTVVLARQPALIIVINTRWHVDDLSGYTLNEHSHFNWEVVKFPAIAEDGETVLWPEKNTLDNYLNVKRAISAREWTAMWQQEPYAQDGGIVKLDWFRRYAELPRNEHCQMIIQSWDASAKAEDRNDPSACTTWAIYTNGAYLLDSVTRRMEFPELKKFVHEHAARWKADLILVEDKSAGTQLVQEFLQGSSVPIKAINPGRATKSERLNMAATAIEGGKIFLPPDEGYMWMKDFLQELASFPAGKHDDQVDSMSQFINWWKERNRSTDLSFFVGGRPRSTRNNFFSGF